MEGIFRLRLLGTPQVERDGEPVRGFRSRKALALLGYLAVQGQAGGPPAAVPRAHLADLFWEDLDESRGRANLSWVLHRISNLLPDCLKADRHAIQFQRTSSYWLDVDAFEELEAEGGAASLAAAVELYRGQFLEGLVLEGCAEFEIWLAGERERWRQRVAQALETLVTRHGRRGEYKRGLRFARRLLALEPWREKTHRQMMRLLARCGQRGAALAQYESCRQTLAEELGVEPMEETTALYERIRAATSAPRHNLPPQPTRFVGREEELAEVIGLLAKPDCRLLTILGPGGVGKTRLALEAAETQTTSFLEGVYFVPLAPVSSPEFVVSAIADVLQLSFSGQQAPRAQLLDYLRDREILLILDSFEHLLAGSGLLVEILRQAPEVKLLVTSRECLNLRWEWRFDVGGLEYPASGTTDGRDLSTYGAVRLFRQVARRVHPGFSLADHSGAAVARICRLVEGMPLAIELAAAWVGAHTCEEIAYQIERNLSFLATSMRDVPQRHRSLRATFEYSWRLLAPAEQRVFERLSVFRRGFRPGAASEVTDASAEILQSLADKSLLRSISSGGYEMHELLRQYAAERLAALPEEHTAARDRHCAYYAAFLQQREADLAGAGAAEALATIKVRIDDIRAAWQWAVTQAEIEKIGRGLNGLSRFYLVAGPLREGEKLIGEAVDRARALVDRASDEAERDLQIVLGELLAEQARFLNGRGKYGQAILGAQAAVELASSSRAGGVEAAGHLQWGRALWRQGSYEAARPRLEQALTRTARALTNSGVRLRQVEAESLRNLGTVCWHVGDYAEASAYHEQALRVCREIGDRRGESVSLNGLGIILKERGDYARAKAHYEQSLGISREIGDRRREGVACNNLGIISCERGDYARAESYLERALRIYREIGDRWGEGLALVCLGLVSHRQGHYAAARRCYEQALRTHCEVGDQWGESTALACLGLLSHHLGDDEAALESTRRALRIVQDIGDPHLHGDVLTSLGYALEGLGRLGEAVEAYERAIALRRELDQPHLAAEPMAGLARVSLGQGDPCQARAWVEKILDHLETGTLDGTDEPFRIYLTCYRVLDANRDRRARSILRTAYELLQERAAGIRDEELRRSFLEKVAAHRKIVEDFRDHGPVGEAPPPHAES